MHYLIFDLNFGLKCVFPILSVIEALIGGGILYYMDWVLWGIRIAAFVVFVSGSFSSCLCWTGLLCHAKILLTFWLIYQIIIIIGTVDLVLLHDYICSRINILLACYGIGFFILMSGLVNIDMKSSSENRIYLNRILLGFLVYVTGVLELYTWKRVKYVRRLMGEEIKSIKKSLHQSKEKLYNTEYVLVPKESSVIE